MSDIQRRFHNDQIASWQSRDGINHRAVGAQMIPNNRDTFIMWTECGQHDVPAGQALTGGDPVNCPECLANGSADD